MSNIGLLAQLGVIGQRLAEIETRLESLERARDTPRNERSGPESAAQGEGGTPPSQTTPEAVSGAPAASSNGGYRLPLPPLPRVPTDAERQETYDRIGQCLQARAADRFQPGLHLVDQKGQHIAWWQSHQVPSLARSALKETLPEAKARVIDSEQDVTLANDSPVAAQPSLKPEGPDVYDITYRDYIIRAHRDPVIVGGLPVIEHLVAYPADHPVLPGRRAIDRKFYSADDAKLAVDVLHEMRECREPVMYPFADTFDMRFDRARFARKNAQNFAVPSGKGA